MFNRETYCKSSIDLSARRQIKHISQSVLQMKHPYVHTDTQCKNRVMYTTIPKGYL